MRPDLPTMLSLALLAVVAGLLMIPFLSGGRSMPSPSLIGGLLLARLGLQVWRAQKDERLKRPASWAFDLILIGLIFYVASGQVGP